MLAIAACICLTVIVLGAYALSWRTLAWERERQLGPPKPATPQCAAIERFEYARSGRVTLRCELPDGHDGPHTAQLSYRHNREHWTDE